MFRKTDSTPQLDMFENVSNHLSKRGAKKYDDPQGWHNQFYNLVTSKIDEDVFSPLFTSGSGRTGAPNASVRQLVALSILKEGYGCSDESLFEKCEFDLLTRKALGLVHLGDKVVSLDTWYLFRRRICEYDELHGVNLMELCFSQVTGEQARQFNISGKTVRMDSKLIGSNIAHYSRYELIHGTFCHEMQSVGILSRLNPSLRKRVEIFLGEDAQKTVYRSSGEVIAERITLLGQVIYEVLVRIKAGDGSLLWRVFHEQYTVDKGKAAAREKGEITASSLQNHNDPDAHYRQKGDQRVKGYSTNITETIDGETGKPGLIVDVQVKPATAPDNGFVQDAVKASRDVTGDTVETVIADGAYQGPDNRDFAAGKDIELVTTGLQGSPSRFELIPEGGSLTVIDNLTGEVIPAVRAKKKWRIPHPDPEAKSKYRYFTPEQVELSLLRRELRDIPPEKMNMRNNVEATIFQYCFHLRNNKTRYRGLLKQKLFSYARCMWINSRRLEIFLITASQRTIDGIFAAFKRLFNGYIEKIISRFSNRLSILIDFFGMKKSSRRERILIFTTF
ncbi:Transposase domain [Porphyromonadaceae bacterium KH3R12]|nr:Transposase domain [Porphyromonadaceae bacterium KH3R12]